MSIGRNLSIIYRLEREYFKSLLEPYHIPANSFAVILNIGKQEGISQKQLCDILQIDEALIARLVRQLEEKNIIYKKRNVSDLRAFQLYLTDLGYEIYPKINSHLKQWWETLLEGLPEELLESSIDTMITRAQQLTKEESK